MKKNQIQVGSTYFATVSGKRTQVIVLREEKHLSRYGTSFNPRVIERTTWAARNIATGREIVVKSAQRLRPIPTGAEVDAIFTALGNQRASNRRRRHEVLSRIDAAGNRRG